jgi:hypothetical protein
LIKQSWLFEKIKPLAKLTNRNRESTQINRITDEKGDITTNIKKESRGSLGNTLKIYILMD